MASSNRLRFGSFTLDAVTRTPITVPHDCWGLTVIAESVDATAYDADSGGNSLLMPADTPTKFPHAFRASKGSDEPLFWAIAAAGTPTLRVIYFL